MSPTVGKRERVRIAQGIIALAIAGTGLTMVSAGDLFVDGGPNREGTKFVDGTVKLGAVPVVTKLSPQDMAPGEVATTPVTVTNTGSLAEMYSVRSTTRATKENPLAGQLHLTIKSDVTSCTAKGFEATGVIIYAGGLLGSPAGQKILGDPASGRQSGDRVLVALASEVLCLQVALPSNSTNTVQGMSTTPTFRFDSEHIQL